MEAERIGFLFSREDYAYYIDRQFGQRKINHLPYFGKGLRERNLFHGKGTARHRGGDGHFGARDESADVQRP